VEEEKRESFENQQAIEALIASAAESRKEQEHSRKSCSLKYATTRDPTTRPAKRFKKDIEHCSRRHSNDDDHDDSNLNHYGYEQRHQRQGEHPGSSRQFMVNYPTHHNIEEKEAKDKVETTETENDTTTDSKTKEPEKPNFGLSGALASDDKTGNMYKGVLLKFTEPPEARTPNTRWRLYVFKTTNASRGRNTMSNKASESPSDELIEVLHISKQSAYLFGREEKVADIPVYHPSLSKQHCVLQYRALPVEKNSSSSGGSSSSRLRCKPYLMDLGSTNGTFINGVRIDEARYYELRKGDVITLGSSSREYVLLTENTTAQDL